MEKATNSFQSHAGGIRLPVGRITGYVRRPQKTACNNSRSISGSCSQVSIIASLICPVFKALSSAGVSMTSPRQVFIITGRRCKEAKTKHPPNGKSYTSPCDIKEYGK